MSTTVDIIIKGAAICYQKANKWHVLFPIDNEGCHTIKFSHRKVDETDSEKTPLVASRDPISITASSAASKTGAAEDFENHVLDLTSKKLPLHKKIKKKGNPTGEAVLMKIENAVFSVHKYLQNFSEPVPDLEEVGTSNRTPMQEELTAHSVKATVILRNNAKLTVKSDVLDEDFVTEANCSYVLTFDNDCYSQKPDRNDMDMFYDVLEDADGSGRRFRLGGVGPSTKAKHKILTEPPDYRNGKPCLVVQVTDPNDLD